MPAGRRAVRLVVEHGLRPAVGDLVDVLATFDPETIGDGDPTIVVAPAVTVVAVDAGTDAGDTVAVTVLVTPHQSTRPRVRGGRGHDQPRLGATGVRRRGRVSRPVVGPARHHIVNLISTVRTMRSTIVNHLTKGPSWPSSCTPDRPTISAHAVHVAGHTDSGSCETSVWIVDIIPAPPGCRTHTREEVFVVLEDRERGARRRALAGRRGHAFAVPPDQRSSTWSRVTRSACACSAASRSAAGPHRGAPFTPPGPVDRPARSRWPG